MLRTRRVPCHWGKAFASARHEARAQHSEDRSSYKEEPSRESIGPCEVPAALQARCGSGRLSLCACCLQAEGRAELVCLQYGAKRTAERRTESQECLAIRLSETEVCAVSKQRGHRRSTVFTSFITSKQHLTLQTLVCCTQWLPRLVSRQRVKGLWTTASCVALNS